MRASNHRHPGRWRRLTIAGIFGALLLVSVAGPPAVATSAQSAPVLVAAEKSGETIDPVSKKPVKKTSIVDYINGLYSYLSVIGGLLAVLMLIYAGYRYTTSYGDPEKISDAKDIIEKALIGLGLLILAALILQTINPRTVQPCNPGTDKTCGDINFGSPSGAKK